MCSPPPPTRHRSRLARLDCRAMYPTIGAISNFDAAVNPLHAPYPTPGSSSNSVAQPPAPQPRPAANGPPSPAAPGFATLQVMIDPRFHLAPPVRRLPADGTCTEVCPANGPPCWPMP